MFFAKSLRKASEMVLLKENIEMFYVKHNKVIKALLLLVFGVISVVAFKFVRNKFEIPSFDLTDNMITMLSAIFGAVVGGVFTLLGTAFSSKQQSKALIHTKRKNLIYKPLYDELAEIQNDILQKNPYPIYIDFDKRENTILKHPQYTAWNRIKNDSRYLEVPDSLKKSMNNLYNSIYDYLNERKGLNEEIRNILNNVLDDKAQTRCTIINIGDVLDDYALAKESRDITPHISDCCSPNIVLDDSLKSVISESFYQECLKSEKISKVKEKHRMWMENQEKTLKLLEMLISIVNAKYEV